MTRKVVRWNRTNRTGDYGPEVTRKVSTWLLSWFCSPYIGTPDTKRREAKALYDRPAAMADEIDLRKGDYLVITDIHEDGWARGKNFRTRKVRRLMSVYGVTSIGTYTCTSKYLTYLCCQPFAPLPLPPNTVSLKFPSCSWCLFNFN